MEQMFSSPSSIKRVCAYGRVSTKHEEQESSLETQHLLFNRWIETHKSQGYELVNEVYEQKTGTLVTKRPKFQQMIEDAKQGKYDCLLFKDSKRFSRNIEDFLVIVRELNVHNVQIIFITEGLVVSNETDRTNLALLGAMSENYSNALHSNLQTSLRMKFNSPLGRVPGDVYGYKRVKGDSSQAIIIPEQADIIRELFNRYADGEGIASIAQDFIDRDIRTYRGGKMSMFALRRYIRNPLYKGLLVMNKYSKPSVRDKRVQNNSEDWVYRERPDLQIVDTELWDKCNSIMDKNQRHMQEVTNGKIGYKHNILSNKLLSKVVVCGCCGRNYNRKESHHKDSSKRYIYLMCGYKKYNKKNQANLQVCTNEQVIRLDYMTKILSEVIKSILESSDSLEDQVQAKIANILKERNRKSDSLLTEQSLKEAEERLKRIVELYKDGLVGKDEYREARDKVKELKSLSNVHSVQISKEMIHELTDKFIGNLSNIISESLVDEGGVDTKAFNRLFDKIVINDGQMDIIFKALGSKQVEPIELKLADLQNVQVFVPIVDNQLSSCKSLVQREKRHKKAKWTADRTSEFIQLGSEDFNGKLTNQVIIGKRKMKIRVYIV